MTQFSVVVIVALLVAYQLFVTILILRADEYAAHQKWLQSTLVWFVPFFGGALVHIMLWAHRTPSRKKDKDFTSQEYGEG
jgi:hypothetical protein